MEKFKPYSFDKCDNSLLMHIKRLFNVYTLPLSLVYALKRRYLYGQTYSFNLIHQNALIK